MTVIELARQERAELLALLSSLAPEQWEEPSLCNDWTVRDVVAHVLSYDDLTARQTLHRFISGRLSTARINAAVLAEFDSASPEQLLHRLSTHLRPTGLPAGMGGRIGLTDALIHHQDIRRPLGLHRVIAHERLRVALPTAIFAPVVQGIRRVYDVCLVATDMPWQFGRGPEVRGSAEALLMTVAGRTVALEELKGPGLSRIAARMSG